VAFGEGLRISVKKRGKRRTAPPVSDGRTLAMALLFQNGTAGAWRPGKEEGL
jgi:hypothetical protein